MSLFSIVPVELLQADLKPNEFRVLVALYSFRNKTTDTVWPGLDLLAERANIRDITTVSKVTTSLQKKGYLSKKKKGFSGRNEYKLTFPELEETSKLEKSSNFDESTNSMLDKTSNSMLDKTSNCKEDTNEQTKEETSNIARSKNIYRKIDISSSFEIIETETAKEFIDHRILKKAPLTQRAFDRIIKSSISIGHKLLMSPDAVIHEVIDAGWQAPKLEWMQTRVAYGKANAQALTPRERAKLQIQQLEEMKNGQN